MVSMLYFRMLRVALRLAGPYVLTPWRSPLLRWRIETYGIANEQGQLLHAEEVSFTRWLRFTVRYRVTLWQFLRWAARL